jgi:hypothetical protein
MYAQVQNIIARCEQCDRMKISFSYRQFMFFSVPYSGHVLSFVM